MFTEFTLKIKKSVWRLLLVVIAAGISSGLLLGQILNTGTFFGTVHDPSGASVPGVTVRLVRVNLAVFNREVKTDEAGNYQAPEVPIGEYRIEFEKAGFQTLIHSDILISAGQSLRVDGDIRVGSVSERINVSGTVAQVDAATANLGNTVSGTQVQELLLSTRSFTQLVTLEPGVSSTQAQQPGFGSNTSVGFSFGGGTGSSNNWLLDGGRNVDPYNGNMLTLVNVDAIAEVRIERNAYSTEYGRNSGAQINVITKSGSNAFHGSLFEYFRNDKMDARNFFALAKSKNRWNDWGGTFGGPLKRDKLFFFLATEFRRIRQVTSIRTSTVPTAAQIAGDFSGGTAIKDPATGLPFANNQIPASRLDPNAQILLNGYYPRPTPGFRSGALNFSSGLPDGVQYRSGLGRLDYNIRPNLTFAGRYNIDGTILNSPYGLFASTPLPTVTASQQVNPTWTANGSMNWTIHPTLLNQFTMAYYANHLPITTSTAGSRTRFPGLNIPRYFNTQTDTSWLIPSLSVAGYASINFTWPEYIRGNTFEVRDGVTYINGRHTIKFGGSIDKENKTQNGAPGNNNGSFTFNGSATGNGLADFVLGEAFQYTETQYHVVTSINFTNLGLYVQDQFRVHPRLTLSYGVRWEFYPPEKPDTAISYFDPTLFDFSKAPTMLSNGQIVPGTQNFGNGVVVPGSGTRYGSAVTNTVYDTFAPRMGFSYVLTKDNLTVLRGGYGMFHDRWSQVMLNGLANYPFSQTISILNTTLSNPAGGTQRVLPIALTSYASPWNVPYMQKWSLGVQRQLPGSILLEVSYAGSKGTHLLRTVDINRPAPSLAVAQGQVSANAVRPYRGLSSITTYQTDVNSIYNSLQTSLMRRFTAGLSVQAAYTFSKSIDDASSPVNVYGSSRLERGLSTADRTHIFIMSYVWELPLARKTRGWQRQTLGGWELSGINSFQSGLPLTIGGSVDWAGIGTTQRPNVVGVPTRLKTLARWFNTAAFAAPPLGTFGNAGRGLVRGPGINNWNLSVHKKFPLRENMALQFRGEFFNVFNHTQWSSVGTTFGSGTFGQVTGALDPRITQLALRLNF